MYCSQTIPYIYIKFNICFGFLVQRRSLNKIDNSIDQAISSNNVVFKVVFWERGIFLAKNDAVKLILGPMIDFYVIGVIMSKSFKLCIINEVTGPKTSEKGPKYMACLNKDRVLSFCQLTKQVGKNLFVRLLRVLSERVFFNP